MGKVDAKPRAIQWAPAPELSDDGRLRTEFDRATFRGAVVASLGAPPPDIALATLPAPSNSTMIEDAGTFRRLVYAARDGRGIDRAPLARWLGWANTDALANYEVGSVQEYHDGRAQAVAALWGIPFDFLAPDGPPLRYRPGILKDLVSRAWTVGLDLESPQFVEFAGVPFETLRTGILAEGPLDESVRAVLVQRFHMRLWPSRLPTAVPDASVLAEELRNLLVEWDLNGSTLGDELTAAAKAAGQKRLGTSPAEVHKFLGTPTLDSGFGRFLATELGYTLPLAPSADDLPWTDKTYYYNAELADLIEVRRHEAGLSYGKLTARTGVNNIQIILATLRKEVEADKPVPPLVCRENVQLLCKELHINVHTFLSLPPLTVAKSETRVATVTAIVSAIRKRQSLMRYSLNALVEITQDANKPRSGNASSTMQTVLAGEVTLDNLHVLERLAELFHIEYDATGFVPATIILEDASKEETGEMLRRQIDDYAILSRQKLCKKLGIGHDSLSHIFGGKYNPADAVFVALRQLLHVQTVAEAAAAELASTPSTTVAAPADTIKTSSGANRVGRWWETQRQEAVRQAAAKAKQAEEDRIARRHEILPRISAPQFLDEKLVRLIAERQRLLDLPDKAFFRASSTRRDSVIDTLRRLAEPVETRDTTCFRGHDTLAKLAHFLGIPLMTRELMPPLDFDRHGSLTADRPAVIAALSWRRRALLMTHKQVLDAIGIPIARLQEMEAGMIRSSDITHLRSLTFFLGGDPANLPKPEPRPPRPVVAKPVRPDRSELDAAREAQRAERAATKASHATARIERESAKAMLQAERDANAQARRDAREAKAEAARVAREVAAADKCQKQLEAARRKEAAALAEAEHREAEAARIAAEKAKRAADLLQRGNQPVDFRAGFGMNSSGRSNGAALRHSKNEQRLALLKSDTPVQIRAPDDTHRSPLACWLEAVQARLISRGWDSAEIQRRFNLSAAISKQLFHGSDEQDIERGDRERARATIPLLDSKILALARALGIYTTEQWNHLILSRSGIQDTLPRGRTSPLPVPPYESVPFHFSAMMSTSGGANKSSRWPGPGPFAGESTGTTPCPPEDSAARPLFPVIAARIENIPALPSIARQNFPPIYDAIYDAPDISPSPLIQSGEEFSVSEFDADLDAAARMPPTMIPISVLWNPLFVGRA